MNLFSTLFLFNENILYVWKSSDNVSCRQRIINYFNEFVSKSKIVKTIIKTIREQYDNSIIIVGTPTWSQDVDIAANKPIKGKNIAYAFHFYAATHKQNLRDKLTKAVKKGLPVIVTEYGLSEASGNGSINIKEGNTWKKLLDKYKIGRVCWNLSNKNETCALIKPSCKKLYGWKKSDLTKQGQWLLY